MKNDDTANNLARSVGMANDPDALLRLLSDPRERPLDIGVASGSWGELTEEDKDPVRAVTVLRETLETYEPRRWVVTIDGEDVSGEYLSIDARGRSHGRRSEHALPREPIVRRENDQARVELMKLHEPGDLEVRRRRPKYPPPDPPVCPPDSRGQDDLDLDGLAHAR